MEKRLFGKLAALTAAGLVAALPQLAAGALIAEPVSPACDAANRKYEELRARSTMDEAQFANSAEAADVMTYCLGQPTPVPQAGSVPYSLPWLPGERARWRHDDRRPHDHARLPTDRNWTPPAATTSSRSVTPGRSAGSVSPSPFNDRRQPSWRDRSAGERPWRHRPPEAARERREAPNVGRAVLPAR